MLRVGWMALRLAVLSLTRNKLRAALTVLGILIGVAAVVAMTAIGTGAQQKIEQQLSTLGVNLLIVFPGTTNTSGARAGAGTAQTLTEDDARAIVREIPAVVSVAPTLSAAVQAVSGGRNWATRVSGTTVDYFSVRAWPLTRGQLWGDSDVRTAGKVCIIGETVWHNLFGNDDPLGQTLRLGRVPCRVIGLLAPKGQSSFGQDQDDTIIVPITTFRARVSHVTGNEVSAILVSARDPSLTRRAEGQITELLAQRHHIGPGEENDFNVRNLQDVAQAFESTRATFTMLLLAIASIALLVGGIGVMNIMLVSVTERTREIGIRLAVGARSLDIMAQFLIEAVTLSAIGGFGGLALGAVAAHFLGKAMEWNAELSPAAAIAAVGIAGGVGVVFGFFPARRAAALDPIQALRHE